MDKLEFRANRLSLMTRTEIMPASMLKASSVSELQTMRNNETARKRLAINLHALSRQETREMEEIASEQHRVAMEIARIQQQSGRSGEMLLKGRGGGGSNSGGVGCDGEKGSSRDCFSMFRRCAVRDREVERKKIKDRMVLVRRRASVLGLTSEEAERMASIYCHDHNQQLTNIPRVATTHELPAIAGDSTVAPVRRSYHRRSSLGLLQLPKTYVETKDMTNVSKLRNPGTLRFPSIGSTKGKQLR